MPLQEFGDASSSHKVFSKKTWGGGQAGDVSFPTRRREEVAASVTSSNVEADGSIEQLFDCESYYGDSQHTLLLAPAESNAFPHQNSPKLDAGASQTSFSGRLDINDLLPMRDPWTAQGPRLQDQPCIPVESSSDVYVWDKGAVNTSSWPNDTNVWFPNNAMHHSRQELVAVEHASPLPTMTSGTPYSSTSTDGTMPTEGFGSFGPTAFPALASDQHPGGYPEPPLNQVYNHQAADSILQSKVGALEMQEVMPAIAESPHPQASALGDPQRESEAEHAIQAAYIQGLFEGIMMQNTASQSTQLPVLSSAESRSSGVFQSMSPAHNVDVANAEQHTAQSAAPPMPSPLTKLFTATAPHPLDMSIPTTVPALMPPQQPIGTLGNSSHHQFSANELRCVCSLHVYKNLSTLRRHIYDKTRPCQLCGSFGRKKRDGICYRCHGVCEICCNAAPSVKDIHRTTVCQGCASGSSHGNPLQ